MTATPRSRGGSRSAPRLETERLVLTIPEPSSSARLLAYAVDNKRHLDPWEPPRPEGFYTEAYWQRRLDEGTLS